MRTKGGILTEIPGREFLSGRGEKSLRQGADWVGGILKDLEEVIHILFLCMEDQSAEFIFLK